MAALFCRFRNGFHSSVASMFDSLYFFRRQIVKCIYKIVDLSVYGGDLAAIEVPELVG